MGWNDACSYLGNTFSWKSEKPEATKTEKQKQKSSTQVFGNRGRGQNRQGKRRNVRMNQTTNDKRVREEELRRFENLDGKFCEISHQALYAADENKISRQRQSVCVNSPQAKSSRSYTSHEKANR